MANYQLQAELRSVTGTREVKKLRKSAVVPAHVYGRQKENVLVSIAQRDLDKALSSGAGLIDLQINGTAKTVIVKEIQKDPLQGKYQHVDFYEVSMDRAIETTVVVSLIGEDVRESDGGIVAQTLRELSISCLPNAIPESIEVNVADLVIGDSIYVKDLQAMEGVAVINDAEDIIVRVTPPTAEEELDTEEGAEAGEAGAEGTESEESDEAQ